ncbi:MAG: glycosyltransferase [Prochlorotrichaceae cyanobacterium]|jgi:tetratricopeptide (TPR) repeat protein
MVRLSLCMIVRNEAETLPQCLKSVSGIVDEAIVLDTGSTDLTVQVARSCGAKVYESTWKNDFALARNECLSYAQGEWVLVLDADEQFIRTTAPALAILMEEPQHLVVNLVREEVGASQSPFSLVSRLFRRHPDLAFTRPYHAMIDDRVETLLARETQWKVVTLEDPSIRHDGYRPGTIAARDKFERARQAMESFLAEHPNDVYTCTKLGALQVEAGNWASGMELLHRALRQASSIPDLCYELHYHLGIAANRLGESEEATEHYQLALQQDVLPVLKIGAHNNLGNLYQAQGDLAAARSQYEAVIRINPNLALGYYNLGLVKKQKGDLWGAIASYETALRLQPLYPEAYQNLGVTLLKLGQVAESTQALQRAMALHQQNGNYGEAQKIAAFLKELLG